MRKEAVAETVGRLAGALPALARIDIIDGRLVSIKEELRACGRGLLPRDEMTKALVEYLRSRRNFGGAEVGVDILRQLSSHGSVRFNSIAREEEVLNLIIWLLGPQEIERLATAAVAAAPYEEGVSTAERARLKAVLSAERAQLVSERRGLVETAQAAGVAVGHLDETQQEIAREKSAAERDAAQRARQEQVAADVEARRHGQPAVGRSSYLASGGESRP